MAVLLLLPAAVCIVQCIGLALASTCAPPLRFYQTLSGDLRVARPTAAAYGTALDTEVDDFAEAPCGSAATLVAAETPLCGACAR